MSLCLVLTAFSSHSFSYKSRRVDHAGLNLLQHLPKKGRQRMWKLSVASMLKFFSLEIISLKALQFEIS